MNKLGRAAIISLSAIAITVSSATIFTKAAINNKNNKYANLTTEQKKNKEEKKLKVDRMISDAESDIIKTLNINKNSYIKIDLSDLPSFSKGTFSSFNDASFYKEAVKRINSELMSVPEGSLEPVILANKKEILFLYKDKDGTNFIKEYKFVGNAFEKTSDNSKAGKRLSLDQY